MIKIFYGERGSGKTQKMVADANEFAEKAIGYVVYLDRDFNRIHDLVREIRLVNCFDYGIKTDVDLLAFIKGLIAGNSDIQRIYIDSIARLTDKCICDLNSMFNQMKELNESFGTEFALTVEGSYDNLPSFVKQYAKEK
ncbi:MAG: hypothetical protein RR054_00460 [Clostridia bacterium]